MWVLRLVVFATVFTSLAVACGGADNDARSDAADSAVDGAADGGAATADDDGERALIGSWVLASATVGGEVVEPPDGVVLDLVIDDGVIDGNGGCNRFAGSIAAASDGTLAITEAYITEAGCEPVSILEFESVYADAVLRADRWEVTPDGFTLIGGDGDGTTLEYVPAG